MWIAFACLTSTYEWNSETKNNNVLSKFVSDVNRLTLKDFCKFYKDLDICCLCPDFLDGSSSCHWKTSVYEGRWVAGTTAGGCMNNLGTSRMSGLELSLKSSIEWRGEIWKSIFIYLFYFIFYRFLLFTFILLWYNLNPNLSNQIIIAF